MPDVGEISAPASSIHLTRVTRSFERVVSGYHVANGSTQLDSVILQYLAQEDYFFLQRNRKPVPASTVMLGTGCLLHGEVDFSNVIIIRGHVFGLFYQRSVSFVCGEKETIIAT